MVNYNRFFSKVNKEEVRRFSLNVFIVNLLSFCFQRSDRIRTDHAVCNDPFTPTDSDTDVDTSELYKVLASMNLTVKTSLSILRRIVLRRKHARDKTNPGDVKLCLHVPVFSPLFRSYKMGSMHSYSAVYI